MNMNDLPSLVESSKKRLGRGHGSGRVKTSGRGQKGQKARGSVPPHFEGGQLSVLKRMPYLRGKMRNKSLKGKTVELSVGDLNAMPKDAVVSLETLKKAGLIATDVKLVKVLAAGKLDHALTVNVPCSEGARTAIEKAGGSVA